MLNSILKKLNGHAIDAESLAAALLQLGSERDETRAQITDLKQRKHQLLLDDGSDGDLDKIERLIDRAETKIEKLNLAEPGLRERLTVAKTTARQQRWRELQAAYHATASDFLLSARSTAAKHEALLAVVSQAQGEGFTGEVAKTVPLTPNVNRHALCAPDLLDIFERELTPTAALKPGLRVGTRPDAIPSWWDPANPAYNHPASKDLRKMTTRPTPAATEPTSTLPKGSPVPDRAPLELGQARVRVLRNGYSPADDRPQCSAGQVIRMPQSTAELSGAVEILETFAAAAATGNAQTSDGART